MKTQILSPGNHGWIESVLDKAHVDFLWKRIEKSTKDVKHQLAGNISNSYKITDDEDDTFFNSVLEPHITMYRGGNSGEDPVRVPIEVPLKLYLQHVWVNYQYKHEFNPIHLHQGMYSFVIWMKIPTDWREQSDLPFLKGVERHNRKASNFEFEFHDLLGNIQSYSYRLDPSMEGTMLFFPSSLKHQVYPFYDSDEARISISGNLWYKEFVK